MIQIPNYSICLLKKNYRKSLAKVCKIIVLGMGGQALPFPAHISARLWWTLNSIKTDLAHVFYQYINLKC